MNIYELYGRLAEGNQANIETFQKTLTLLRDLKAGDIDLKQLTVTNSGWTVNPPEEDV